MDKIKANFREFVRSKTTKVMMIASLACCMLVMSASAVDGEASSIDVSAITSSFTQGFQSMVTNSISMISAMVPIALTLSGVVFLVKKGMSWFKGVAK